MTVTGGAGSMGSSTSVSDSPGSAVFGESDTFTATVSSTSGIGTPTGSVAFICAGGLLGTATLNSAGVATLTTSSLGIGSDDISASYGGDSTFSGSSGDVILPIGTASSSTVLTSNANPSVFGQSVTFTATVSAVSPGSGTPTGSVDFTCGGSDLGSYPLINGSASFIATNLPVSTGETIDASYSGDSDFSSSSDSITQTVNPDSSTTTISASPGTSVYGQSVQISATVSANSPGSGTPTGTVAFACGSVNLGSYGLSGGSVSFNTTSLPVGSNETITATYSGDSNFAGSSGSAIQTVNKAATTTTVSGNPNASVYGQAVTFTATVSVNSPGSGTPTGTVTFELGSTVLGSESLSGNTATYSTTSPLPTGSDGITATYSGDSNFNGSSGTATQTVNKADTTTTVSASPGTSVHGQSVQLTATASANSPGSGTPTGTVSFSCDGVNLGSGTLSGGSVSINTTQLPVGSNETITATYSGDSNFNNSSGTTSQTVNKADTTTTLTANPSTSVTGQTVTLTATVAVVSPGSGTPTGTVSFSCGGVNLGSGTLSGGSVTINTTQLPVGSNETITATYSGDSNFNGSSGTTSDTVNKADTTTSLSADPNPSVFGQSVTFTATVSVVSPGSGTPTGGVTFYYGSIVIGSGTLSGGTVTCPYDQLPVGADVITATYSGDSNFNGSSGTTTQTVNKADTSTSLSSDTNPSVFGQSVTFTATVSVVSPGSGTPTGMVTFLDGTTTLGTGSLNAQDVATFTTSTLTVGSHSITAVYAGDSNFNGSTSSALSQTVDQAATSTTVSASPDPSVFGQSVQLTATVSVVSGTPTGTVAFACNGVNLGSGTLSGGSVTINTTQLPVGSNETITATYSGDSNFAGSSGSTTQTVNKANTTTSLSASPNPSVFGQSVTFTATVSVVSPGSGTPTGMVTFYYGSIVIGSGTLAGGTATCSSNQLPVGADTITASYSGDSNFNGSSGSTNQTVNKANTTTTLTSDVNPSVFGQSVTFTATVSVVSPGSGTPTGTVTFYYGSIVIGSGTLAGGTVTCSSAQLPVGADVITATYSGDSNFNGSTSPNYTQTVNKANTTTTLTSDVNPSVFGQSVTFTATGCAAVRSSPAKCPRCSDNR